MISLRKSLYRSCLLATSRLIVVTSLLFGSGVVSSQENSPQAKAIESFNSAQDLHEKGDLRGAIDLYERSLASHPQFPEAEYQRGVAFLALGDRANAEKAFRRAVTLREDWTLAMTSLGSVLIGQKNDEAKVLLQKVLAIEPQNPPALSALVEVHLLSGETPAMLQDLLTKVSTVTSKADATAALWTAKAAVENALGQSDSAKSSLRKALSIDPKHRGAMVQLGEISLSEGDIEKARGIVSQIEDSSSTYGPLIVLKAGVMANEGNFDKALIELETLTMRSSAADRLRAKILAAKATRPADLEKQLEANTSDPVLLARLCSLYRLPDPQKALGYCRRASEAEPGNIDHAVGFGAALVQARQYEAAVDLLSKIIRIASDNATARANLASALFQLKRYPEAKVEFKWLTNAQPRSAGAYYFLGLAHDHLTEYIDAAANYQEYLKLADPEENKDDIGRLKLRLPQLQRLIKEGKGKKNG